MIRFAWVLILAVRLPAFACGVPAAHLADSSEPHVDCSHLCCELKCACPPSENNRSPLAPDTVWIGSERDMPHHLTPAVNRLGAATSPEKPHTAAPRAWLRPQAQDIDPPVTCVWLI